MKLQSESGVQHLNSRDKFVKFYLEREVVDGIVLKYSFSSLVKDIRRPAVACNIARPALMIQGGRWRFCESK